jgi:hypothetical protein
MSHDEWADLIQRHIVNGEEPPLLHQWEVDTPETYVARRYFDAGEPKALRDALINVLESALRENNTDALGRGLLLATFIAHPDFAASLQEIFFSVRLTGLETQYSDAAQQALRAMHALQSKLEPSSEVRAVWKARWLSLLDDKRYGIAAFQGLRELDPILTLSNIHLLLQQKKLPESGLDVLLRGLRRDALAAKEAEDPNSNPNLVDELASAIAKLTAVKFIRHRSVLSEAFGEDFEKAEREYRRKVVNRIGQASKLLETDAEPTLRWLRRKLFPPLAAWLKDQTPVAGVSIWLVDRKKGQVHFMAQAGCPGKEQPIPPRILEFSEGAS